MSAIETHHLSASDLGGGKGFLDWLKGTTSGLSEVAQTVWGTINTIENKSADNVTPGAKPNQSGTQTLVMDESMKKLLITGAALAVGATVIILIARKK